METISSASSALSKRLLKLSPRTDATILVAGSQKMLSDVLAATGGGAVALAGRSHACQRVAVPQASAVTGSALGGERSSVLGRPLYVNT